MTAASFYDELASHYHLVFADWDDAIERQSRIFSALLATWDVPSGAAVLDCSCGIGTQALALAGSGFAVQASDISEASVERAAREATRRGVELETRVADMRRLPWRDEFAAVLSMDNAVAHLLDETALGEALSSMCSAAEPGGALALSLRDYRPLLRDRPAGTVPSRFDSDGDLHVYVQSWRWHDDAPAYDAELFLLSGPDWTVSHSSATFRAWTVQEVSDVAERSGWIDITVIDPQSTGFYQPIVWGRRPEAAGA